jgi:hypothetical protein
MWDLWWTKIHWGRFCPSTSDSPANHSTDCSTLIIIIIRGRYSRSTNALSNRGLGSTPPRGRKLTSLNNIHKCLLLIPNARGYNWATLFLGKINTGTSPSRLGGGVSKIDTIKYLYYTIRVLYNKICSWVPWDSDLRKAALAIPGKNWKLQTRLLVREGAPQQLARNYLKIMKERRGKIGRVSQMGAWHRQTGRLTVGRNITFWLLLILLVVPHFLLHIFLFFPFCVLTSLLCIQNVGGKWRKLRENSEKKMQQDSEQYRQKDT